MSILWWRKVKCFLFYSSGSLSIHLDTVGDNPVSPELLGCVTKMAAEWKDLTARNTDNTSETNESPNCTMFN